MTQTLLNEGIALTFGDGNNQMHIGRFKCDDIYIEYIGTKTAVNYLTN